MSRWSVALFALVVGIATANPVRADFSLVRWPSGDCKIWDNFPGNPPAGIPGRDWIVLAPHIPTYDEAWRVLYIAAGRRDCAWI
jgi:hypothetical protein